MDIEDYNNINLNGYSKIYYLIGVPSYVYSIIQYAKFSEYHKNFNSFISIFYSVFIFWPIALFLEYITNKEMKKLQKELNNSSSQKVNNISESGLSKEVISLKEELNKYKKIIKDNSETNDYLMNQINELNLENTKLKTENEKLKKIHLKDENNINNTKNENINFGY